MILLFCTHIIHGERKLNVRNRKRIQSSSFNLVGYFLKQLIQNFVDDLKIYFILIILPDVTQPRYKHS